MESHFFCPLHAFSHAAVGANHLIIPVNSAHVLIVLYKLGAFDHIYMLICASEILNIINIFITSWSFLTTLPGLSCFLVLMTFALWIVKINVLFVVQTSS